MYRRAEGYKGKPSELAFVPLSAPEGLKTPPVPVLARVWPGSGDGTERVLKGGGIRASAWSCSGREGKEEAPAGPGGDPAGTLILSTVAKGLVVSGIIHQCGRFR